MLATRRAVDEAFFFRVDTVAATYRTFLAPDRARADGAGGLSRITPDHGWSRDDPPGDDGADGLIRDRPLDGKRQIVATPGRPVVSVQPYLPPVCDCDTCGGYWTVSIKTLDPLLYELTNTTANASWSAYEDSGGCQWSAPLSGTCWGANPSPLNTHWFISSCQKFPSSSYLNLDLTVVGNYYNWDFGNPSQATYVTQTARISLATGIGVSIDWSHYESGEYSSLAFGWFSQNGTNNCF